MSFIFLCALSLLEYPDKKLHILLVVYTGMKFSKKELHVGLKVHSSKKRKRDDSGNEIATKKVIAEVMEEQSKVALPVSSALITPMLEYLFRITKTSPEAEVEASDQHIKVGMDAPPEAESESYPTEKGKANLEEGVGPLLMYGSIGFSLKVEPTPVQGRYSQAMMTSRWKLLMSMGR